MTEGSPGFLNGRYRLKDLIGRGGMASVYRATDERLGRDVAIKIFDAAAATEIDIARQQAEINVLASLNHHSVTTLFDVGVHRADAGRPRIYLVMELVAGADLRRRLDQDPLSTRHIAQVGYDLAEGLDYIHGRGVVHRDIKPANILLAEYSSDSRTRARLTDFGIALFPDAARMTNQGLTTGTAAYLSPEQARGDRVGPPSDIYALGLVLLECFTGETAFPGQPVQSAVARLLRDPAMPETLAPAWRDLLTSMLARDPEQRPPAADVVLALRQAVIAETGRHRVMETHHLDADEPQRLDEVARLEILDTPPDGTFDRIAALAARVFSVPIAIVSIVDTDRIWFKAHHGLDLKEIPRDPGLCASAILSKGPWLIEDARRDPRALANPLVAEGFGLQFYAGVPLTTQNGYNLGTLCVLDHEPRTVTAEEIATLEDLAALVMNELELRLESRRAVHH
ncbi:GAF domain-containing protein [Cryobacterium sp. TMT1-21]|uniref:GAF domain-containing protein n=1 Tax=Cryobacterium shii TaxID=1259235 RepID=A0AAQ2C5S5_9MICO|nr:MULTISPECIES: GAF domain-containing serine/threonine-protein kinase [Cryobacterium]TFC46603.1 GAF domain-containing protein [Cryobacterium shii]TFD17621.1 GAF domain-containing protein [Cryobacterium sp. TMT1-21]TFD22702.1 GAF domain-containing protein [Cryobacterium sp. TMT2-23]TFD43335.1 GAF domain-containing protein [Cryobacterium sp. TMT2-10]